MTTWVGPLSRIGFALLVAACTAASGQGVKIGVNRTGLQAVTGAQLQQAGLNLAALDPARLGLRCGKETVALRLADLEGGKLTTGSRLIFCGQALDTPYTDTNAYWLSLDGQHSARMAEVPLPQPAGDPVASLPATQHFEQNGTYAYLMGLPAGDDTRPWFWGLTKPNAPVRATFDLPHLADPAAPAALRVRLFGRVPFGATDPGHRVQVAVNGTAVGEAKFEGQSGYTVEAPVPAGTLKRGANALTVTSPADGAKPGGGQAYLDWIEVSYQRDLVADAGGATLSAPEGAPSAAEVTSLPVAPVDWYDIADPNAPSVAPGVTPTNGRLRFGTTPGHRYAVVTADGYGPPASVTQTGEPTLRAEGRGADYLVIAHESLVAALAPLAAHREKQGLRVAIVPVSQTYDEFADGVFTPLAIRDFVAYALAHWAPRPRFLLLVGDATYDYRGYTAPPPPSSLPSMTVRERGGIEVAADAAYALDEAGRPALAVGRIPAQTEAQVRRVVENTIRAEDARARGACPKKLVVVADQEGFGPMKDRFSLVGDAWAKVAETAGFSVEKWLQTDVGLTEDMDGPARIAQTKEKLTAGLLAALRAGPGLIFYMGHGDEFYWGYNQLLAAADLKGTEAESPAICIQDTCFAGGFDVPDGKDTISEAMLWSGLCVATYTSSRLGGNDVQMPLLRYLLEVGTGTLGEAILQARRERVLRGEDGLWAPGTNLNLLGDPALSLSRPAQP
jgi:Peptidase family C25